MHSAGCSIDSVRRRQLPGNDTCHGLAGSVTSGFDRCPPPITPSSF